MAKFLPFVVEKSTPLHTYQTIVSRSKGMNEITIASIFWLVLDKGIATVRKAASDLPDNMNLDKVYEELLNNYSSYRISNEDFKAFQMMAPLIIMHAKDKISDELAEYTMEDTMSFLLVMHYMDKVPDYTPLPLKNLLNGEATNSEFKLTAYKLFSNDGGIYEFETRDEISAYIWFHAVVLPEGTTRVPVKAVYTGTGNGYSNKKPKGNTRFDKNSPDDTKESEDGG